MPVTQLDLWLLPCSLHARLADIYIFGRPGCSSSHLQAYKHVMDPSVNPNCPKCEEAPHTVEHWLDCPRHSTSPFGDLRHYWTVSVDSLNIPGQVGCTGKAHIVMPRCACHHQQQQQQQSAVKESTVQFCRARSSGALQWDSINRTVRKVDFWVTILNLPGLQR